MDANYILQYTLVGLILLAVCVLIVVKTIRKSSRKGSGGCCGCSLNESCQKKHLK